jgi:hypothetical protein
MPISIAENGMLLLTPDLMQRDGRFEQAGRRSGDANFGRLKFRFPLIEDLVSALDRIALREIAA